MQTYPLKLTAAAASRLINTAANLFVYESAAAKTRTNLMLRTEEFDNATWTKTRITAVPDSAVLSPLGTSGVEKLVEDTSNNTHMVTQKVSGIAPGRYTFSAYVKPAERSIISIGTWDGATSLHASFDLVAGTTTFVRPGIVSTRIQSAGNGWMRCSITVDIVGSYVDASIYLTNGSSPYPGDGTSGAHVWGAMVEAGDVPTFYIRSGAERVVNDDYESRIVVKPDNGNDIVLRPGQRFRLPPGERANQWQIRSYDGTTDIDGQIIIGSGEFEDSNTVNKFKLDATFSNTVQVSNTTAQRVPVTLDTAQTLPVSMTATKINNTTAERVPVSLDPAQVFNTSEGTVAYTKAWASFAALAAGAAVQVLAPAENVNGVILNMFKTYGAFNPATNGAVSLIAKTTAPTNANDGDVVFMAMYPAGVGELQELPRQIVIPAGKGLWLYPSTGESNGCRQALMTVL